MMRMNARFQIQIFTLRGGPDRRRIDAASVHLPLPSFVSEERRTAAMIRVAPVTSIPAA
jgi:hypothetical protein